MRGPNDSVAKTKVAYNTAASGGASIVTLTPVDTEDAIVIDDIKCAYETAPTSGSVTVADTTNSNTIMVMPITAEGPVPLGWAERGYQFPKNATVTITLADGTATKHLSVFYR